MQIFRNKNLHNLFFLFTFANSTKFTIQYAIISLFYNAIAVFGIADGKKNDIKNNSVQTFKIVKS